ncbi:MAG: sigma 54-interacting transcriptional regulator [Deltaproteobacteria bacterium]|nr:sigma 54-interacting transcriptional regulator [Deltaproteobacteria bacterium]
MDRVLENEWGKYWPVIADTMAGGLALIGPDGRILLVNRAFEKITGYGRDDILGQTCDIFNCDACEGVKSEDKDFWCRLFQDPDRKIEGCRCELIGKDGLIVPVLKNAAVLRDKRGEILGAIETVVDISELEKRDKKIEELSRFSTDRSSFYGMQGQTKLMRNVFGLIEKAAMSDFPVVIYGESGTGKELAAHAIHQLSQRCDNPFVAVNCASLNESLLESEFFGHVKGAFTGAYRHRVGRFEAAGDGSIFLDEIGDMPMSTQAKLLRVLETKRIERVGEQSLIPINARFIFATNRNLPDLVKSGHFREDLFFRINVIPIHIPALRERIDDLPLIAENIILDLAKKTGKPITGLSRNALDHCLQYPWEGNVRELKNALQYAFVVAESGPIELEHLPNHLTGREAPRSEPEDTIDLNGSLHERQTLIEALQKAGGNRSEAARILNVARATVWNRIRKYNIQIEQIIK